MTIKSDEILEVSRSDLDPDYVRRRIDDWVERIEVLYAEIRQAAAADNIKVEDGAPVQMHEEVMKKYNVPPRQLPTLLISKPQGVIKVVPRGLWVIGANGRIDLITSRGLFMLVDFAVAPFEEPVWRIYGPTLRDGVDYSPGVLFGLVP